MHHLLALTDDSGLLSVIARVGDEIRIEAFVDALDFVDKFIFLHNSVAVIDIDFIPEQTVKVIRLLKNIRRSAKIILLLSPDQMPVCSAAYREGATYFLVRPVSEESVKNLVRRTLNIQDC